MRIVVYAISKNEEAFVERCLASAKEADGFVLADTGSTDQTVELARANGASVYSVSVQPWRFDVARNTSLALVPADADVCVCIDLDEVLEPGWREEVERLWVPGTTRLRYLFDWGNDVRFMSDKIHARSGYRWKHPCHEALTPDPRLTQKYAVSEKLLVRHLPDPKKSRGQYLELLRVGAKEDPTDPRNSFYFARELTYYAKWEEAIRELTRYLELPGAKWSAERGYAMRLVGKSLVALGKTEEAHEWYRKAVTEAPDRRESWFDLASFCHDHKLWPECYEAAKWTIRTEGHRNAWPTDPVAWGYRPFDLAALAAYALGKYDEAAKYGAEAIRLSPDDPRLRKNLTWYVAKGVRTGSTE